MSSRRSRGQRSRKAAPSSEAPPPVADRDPTVSAVHVIAPKVDATETAQLRALEAGWDELLT